MKKVTKYVVMCFFAPNSKKYTDYDIRVYSKKSSNKQTIIDYCRQLKQQKTYLNDNRYKQYIVTEERALKEQLKLQAWKTEQERKYLEKRFPVRYHGQTAREELAEMMKNR